jgi:hypothetical protein
MMTHRRYVVSGGALGQVSSEPGHLLRLIDPSLVDGGYRAYPPTGDGGV